MRTLDSSSGGHTWLLLEYCRPHIFSGVPLV